MNPCKYLKTKDPKLNVYNIDWNSEFERQVDRILEEISMTQEQKNEVEVIKNKLERAICAIWPDAKISMYGSMETGLGLYCSDADFSVDSTRAVIPSSYLLTVKSSILTVSEFRYPEEHLYPVPFISVLYSPTQRFFDLTFNNDRAKATTALVSSIMKIDERIFQITMIIKFWCKAHGMVGHKRLTCMIIYMLVIFYLQQEGLLPSVASMLDTTNCRYVEGYNVALKEHIIEKMNEDKSLLQLVGGFFEYYAKFAWSSKVICPFAGILYEKEKFRKGVCDMSLPDIFQDYKNHVQDNPSLVDKSCYLYVQNPLFLTQNLTADVEYKFLKYFLPKFTAAASSYRYNSYKGKNNNFLKQILVR